MDFSGRAVLVSGASSGFGAACAELFAGAGARLALCARRGARLQELAAGLRRRHGAAVHDFVLDVRDAAAVQRAVAALPPAFRDVDVLVNNAGLARGFDLLQDGSPADWDEMIDTNVKGLLYLTRAVLPGMVARGRGHVINVGSLAGREVYPKGNVYCATKHAVHALTQGMRMDLSGTGVKVSTVDPGAADTEFSAVRFHGDRERAAKVYQGYTPLSAADVAEVIYWVASRPEHVNVAEVVLLPSSQASTTVIHRRP